MLNYQVEEFPFLGPEQIIPTMCDLSKKRLAMIEELMMSDPSLVQDLDILMYPEPHYLSMRIRFCYQPTHMDMFPMMNLYKTIDIHKYPKVQILYQLRNKEYDVVKLGSIEAEGLLVTRDLTPSFIKALIQWNIRAAQIGGRSYPLLNGNEHLTGYMMASPIPLNHPWLPKKMFRVFSDPVEKDDIMSTFLYFTEDTSFTKRYTKLLLEGIISQSLQEEFYDDNFSTANMLLRSLCDDSGMYCTLLPNMEEPNQDTKCVSLD